MGVVSINAITHTKSDNDEAKLRSAKTVFDYLDKNVTENIEALQEVYASLASQYMNLYNNYNKLRNNYNILATAYNNALSRKKLAEAAS